MPHVVKRTMLIDDSETDLFIHRRFLELSTFSKELIAFRSAAAALESLRDTTDVPDIIFLDLNMPVVDGFAFLRDFSRLPAQVRSPIRIVVLTSSNSPSDREKAFLCENVVKMITKPIRPSDIDALRLLVAN